MNKLKYIRHEHGTAGMPRPQLDLFGEQPARAGRDLRRRRRLRRQDPARAGGDAGDGACRGFAALARPHPDDAGRDALPFHRPLSSRRRGDRAGGGVRCRDGAHLRDREPQERLHLTR